MRRRIDFKSGFAVEPHAAAALPRIAATAQRGAINIVQLPVCDFRLAGRRPDAVRFVFVIKGGANVKFAIGRKRDVFHSGVAVVHPVEQNAVGQDVDLREMVV